jgi:uncharacterized protein YcfJ
MSRAIIGGVLIGVTLATSGAVVAGFASRDTRYAEVLDVQEITQDVRLPRRVCDEAGGKSRCHTVQDVQHDLVGYSVRYRLGDTVDTVRTKTRPPERIPVRDGHLVLGDSAARHR